jgi:tetratricopeptide (TPR) repeat protein
MPRLGDDFRARVVSDIPVLFVSGTLDGRTPISNAKEIAEGFSDHRHLIIRNASHGGDLFTSSPKILESVKMFLRGETLPWTEIDGPEWQFDPPRQRSLEHEMLQVLTSEGFDAAVARYMEIREKFAGQPVYDFRESVLNELGYRVLRGGRSDVELAINVFRLNTVGYPESFNTWDSLAEGYMEKGDSENATRFYEKSLELNPDNSNAMQMLGRVRETSD